MIVHLNGWPGVGKKTVGAALAARLGARFVHNHLLHDVAIVCAGRGSDLYWSVYERVRAAAYDGLADRLRDEVLVMTNALCRNTAVEVAAWGHVVDLAMRRAVLLVPVVLAASPEENARRVRSEGRVGRKLSDPAVLLGYFALDTIQVPVVPETLELDTTDLSPDEAARRIEGHIAAVRPSLRAATRQHLAFR